LCSSDLIFCCKRLKVVLRITSRIPIRANCSQLAWYRKQLARIGIRLVIRNTTFNRLQQKMAAGNIQLFSLGWIADYPDPENFLFLLYGPNGKVKHGGVNIANYQNDKFDALYAQMRTLPNGAKRKAVIARMVHILIG